MTIFQKLFDETLCLVYRQLVLTRKAGPPEGGLRGANGHSE